MPPSQRSGNGVRCNRAETRVVAMTPGQRFMMGALGGASKKTKKIRCRTSCLWVA